MIGLKCKICDKTVRLHTKKIRIAKNSEEFNHLKKFFSNDNKPVKLKRTYGGKVYSTLLLPEDEKGNVYIIEFVDELYQLICCSDGCRREYERQKTEKRKERVKHNFQINSLLPKIKERCNNKCISCGAIENIEIHHIKPLSQGGKAELANLILLCKDCHLIASNKSNSKTKKWKNDFEGNRINPEFKYFKKRIEEKINKFQQSDKV